MEGMRVLVVEDQPNVARALAKGLREQSYAVDVATDGEEGLFRAESGEYDLVILDVMLPKIGGFEICRRLRERKIAASILMLTARDDKRSRLEGLDTGADDYLTKPFDFDELLARVRALLRRSRVYVPARLCIADVELDTNRKTATRGGREISLTAKEYALLEHFMRNPERVVTREEIARRVWDETFDPFSNVIEVYVGRLRKKREADAKPRLLHTRRGLGYVLSQEAGDEE
jgi:two-component system copper resistance phosphate regulon response regulator CusR